MGSSGITPHPGLLIATAICGFAESDGVITEDELTIFKSAAMVLNSDPALMQSLHAQLKRVHILGRVLAGHLPRNSAVGLHLPTDEHCQLNIPATRLRCFKSGMRQVGGPPEAPCHAAFLQSSLRCTAGWFTLGRVSETSHATQELRRSACCMD